VDHSKVTGLITLERDCGFHKAILCASVGLGILVDEWRDIWERYEVDFISVGPSSSGMGCIVKPKEYVLV